MYIDFHTHGKLAKKLPFSTKYTDSIFQKAKTRGLDGIVLTEHFNTLSFIDMYEYIYQNYKHTGDGVQTDNGVMIFFGMEIDIAEGGHTLVVGHYDDIVELNIRLEPHKQKGNFLPFDDLLKLIREYDVLFGAGHAYRKGGHIPELEDHQLSQFDFFDLNGKDLSENMDKTKQQIYALAFKYQKPVVSGSDTHQWTQYGCVKTCFDHNIYTLDDLFTNIKNQNYHIEIAESLKIQVEDATIQKKLLKEVHALGGDYTKFI